ncbi:MAG: serine/threonine-protein kinase, partial [Verrucomicrobiales bacterium]|nr:serine/threonine-protein kinase [Verrucomicrobiales bacterium]
MDSESDDIIINQCPECGQGVDVSSLSPFSKIECPHCNVAVRVRTRLGQYEILGPLGEGGMSQVFSAEDITLGRKVALKILHQELSLDSKLTEMFEREAKLTASINHPNVVKVYTVGHEGGYFYIAMELVHAISVEQIIAEQGALPEEKVLQMAYDVVSGLKAAYQLNLIHRDIKPGNILVTEDGTAKLVDFGLAVVQGGADENEDIWATPFYVPPEKLVREPDTHLGDIYALGATCYHALAGQPPFVANTSSLEELIEIKSRGVDLKSVAPNATLPTVKLIERMMSYSAAARPSSYDELLKKIQIRQNELGAVPQVSAHSVKSDRKGLFVKLGIGVVTVVAVLFFVFQSKKGQSGSDEIASLLGTSGERVISAAEREAAGKMLSGRSAMVRGRFGEALNIFSDLEGNANFTQPTLGWNTFNHGLVELLMGNEKSARNAFQSLRKQKGFDDPAHKPYDVFFSQIGAILSDPLPVLRSDVRISSETFEAIGLLAAGLKNWEQDQFEEAGIFLRDFGRIGTLETDPWIAEMKPVTGKYLADLAAYEKLPNPSVQMSASDLKKVKAQLESAEDKARTSRMKQFIRARLRRAESFIEDAKKKAPPPPKVDSDVWTDEENAEVSQLQKLVESLPDYKSNYAFSEALASLENAEFTTPKGKALHQDLIEGYKKAGNFLPSLVERFNSGNYQGKIRRKTGMALDAAITSATVDTFVVDLGFGPNDVGIGAFETAWLVEAAE